MVGIVAQGTETRREEFEDLHPKLFIRDLVSIPGRGNGATGPHSQDLVKRSVVTQWWRFLMHGVSRLHRIRCGYVDWAYLKRRRDVRRRYIELWMRKLSHEDEHFKRKVTKHLGRHPKSFSLEFQGMPLKQWAKQYKRAHHGFFEAVRREEEETVGKFLAERRRSHLTSEQIEFQELGRYSQKSAPQDENEPRSSIASKVDAYIQQLKELQATPTSSLVGSVDLQPLAEEEKKQLEAFEHELTVEDMVRYRSFATSQLRAALRTAPKSANARSAAGEGGSKQEKAASRGIMTWLFGSNEKEVDEVLAQEEREELYRVIEYSPAEEGVEYPSNYTISVVKVAVESFQLTLSTTTPLATCSLRQLSFSGNWRAVGWAFQTALGELEARDVDSSAPTDALFRPLIRGFGTPSSNSTIRHSEPLVAFEYDEISLHSSARPEATPARSTEGRESDVWISVKLRPVECILRPLFLSRIAVFFSSPAADDVLPLSSEANLSGSGAVVARRAVRAVADRPAFSITADISGPKLILPQDETLPDSPVLILDMGELVVRTVALPSVDAVRKGLQSYEDSKEENAARDLASRFEKAFSDTQDTSPGSPEKRAGTTDSPGSSSVLIRTAQSGIEGMNPGARKACDHYTVSLSSLQGLLCRMTTPWRSKAEQEARELAFLRPVDIQVDGFLSCVPDDDRVPTFSVACKLWPMVLSLSSAQLQAILELVDELTRSMAPPPAPPAEPAAAGAVKSDRNASMRRQPSRRAQSLTTAPAVAKADSLAKAMSRRNTLRHMQEYGVRNSSEARSKLGRQGASDDGSSETSDRLGSLAGGGGGGGGTGPSSYSNHFRGSTARSGSQRFFSMGAHTRSVATSGTAEEFFDIGDSSEDVADMYEVFADTEGEGGKSFHVDGAVWAALTSMEVQLGSSTMASLQRTWMSDRDVTMDPMEGGATRSRLTPHDGLRSTPLATLSLTDVFCGAAMSSSEIAATFTLQHLDISHRLSGMPQLPPTNSILGRVVDSGHESASSVIELLATSQHFASGLIPPQSYPGSYIEGIASDSIASCA